MEPLGRDYSPAPVTRTDWAGLAGVVSVHLLAAFAPFTFTWAGLATAAVLYLLTGVGVSAGYHRLFAHQSFVAVRPLRWLLGLLGALAVQGGPLWWCAFHRLHHGHADRPADPQQSGAGLWRAHLGWVTTGPPDGGPPWHRHPVIADLRRDSFLRLLEVIHAPMNFMFIAVLFATGWVIGGWALGASLVTWGVGVRVAALWHSTLTVNSVAHRRGYRNYPTPDNSRNVWWLLPITFGECWHNNHHAHPGAAAHGHRWFEADPSAALIRVCGWLGLATRIVRPRTGPQA